MPDILATLTPDEAATLKAALRALSDARAEAEIATNRHKAAVIEADLAVVRIERDLAMRYGYDAERPARLMGCALMATEAEK